MPYHNMVTVRELLSQKLIPAVELRGILTHITGLSYAQLLSHDQMKLTQEQESIFYQMLSHISHGVPLAYLTGYKEFFMHRFKVTPATLIPRPETELLVTQALRLAGRGAQVVDLGTGSGCIALSLKLARPDLWVTAVDVSVDALAVAQENALTLGAQVELLHSDWLSAVPPQQQFDLIVSNPPYISSGDAHLCNLVFEPQRALTAGEDGLSCIHNIANSAKDYLKPGGWLLLEHGYDQGAVVREIFKQQGLVQVYTLCDLAGIERVCVGYNFK
jgi:release factor glutamine methyltransferase